MTNFLDNDFLLTNQTSKELYHNYAANLPIIDYHCHINPKEIAENKTFKNLTQLWLGGDHYKWRLMRSNGVDEYYITGDADDYEKFEKWVETVSLAIGNPLYHWSHLELKRYFQYDKPLCPKNAREIWDFCNQKLKLPSLSTRGIIESSNVEVICTTDDPVDDLIWHKYLKEDTSFSVKVLPTFRPDKAMNLESPDYLDYIKSLQACTNISITNFSQLQDALISRMKYFDELGCRLSDHGLDYVMFTPASLNEVDDIFQKRLWGESLTAEDISKFKTYFMLFVAQQYSKLSWTMQLHYGCLRNNNSSMYQSIGVDTGFDCISNYTPAKPLIQFLDTLNLKNELPKTILYSLNPIDNALIDTIIGCFQDSSARGKIQHGSAWWFNDHKKGMTEHLTTLASQSMLSNFVGMLTDSRSFLSYTRHEYFRRILCNLVGTWVEDGEYPNDPDLLKQIITNISYQNAKNYFHV